jgi:two-component system, NarL family, nitrate/nitrite response regulator NarL
MRVLVVSANRLAQAGLGALVEQAEGLEVAGAISPEDAAAEVARSGPEAVLIDSAAGESDALALVEELRRAFPAPLIAVLADASETVAYAIGAGAGAVLPAAVSPGALARALAAAAAGLTVLGPEMATGLLRVSPEVDSAPQPVERLTPRESEVLQLLARGLTNAEIARRLSVSEHTAKFHVGAVLGKLGARSRAEAVALGLRLGWITV